MVVAVARRGLRCSSCTKRIYSAAAAMGFLMGLVREREIIPRPRQTATLQHGTSITLISPWRTWLQCRRSSLPLISIPTKPISIQSRLITADVISSLSLLLRMKRVHINRKIFDFHWRPKFLSKWLEQLCRNRYVASTVVLPRSKLSGLETTSCCSYCAGVVLHWRYGRWLGERVQLSNRPIVRHAVYCCFSLNPIYFEMNLISPWSVVGR